MNTIARALPFVACLLASSPAAAQDYDKASRYYATALDQYSKGKFKDAAVAFGVAYAETKDPVLLFNLAKTFESSRDYRGAVTAYRRYLAAVAGASDKADVEKHVAELEERYHIRPPIDWPKPPAELAALKPSLGRWQCDAKDHFPSELGGDHAAQAEWTMRLDLGDFTLTGRYEERKTKDNDAPIVRAESVGWDGESKKLVRSESDNLGSWTGYTAPGVEGGKLVWTGDRVRAGKKTAVRETIDFKGDTQAERVYEEQAKDGWVKTSEASCKKVAGAAKPKSKTVDGASDKKAANASCAGGVCR